MPIRMYKVQTIATISLPRVWNCSECNYHYRHYHHRPAPEHQQESQHLRMANEAVQPGYLEEILLQKYQTPQVIPFRTFFVPCLYFLPTKEGLTPRKSRWSMLKEEMTIMSQPSAHNPRSTLSPGGSTAQRISVRGSQRYNSKWMHKQLPRTTKVLRICHSHLATKLRNHSLHIIKCCRQNKDSSDTS